MEDSILEILELNKIKNILQKYAATEAGREVIGNLRPVTQKAYVERSLAEVSAAKELLQEFGPPPLGGVRDLRGILKKCRKGMVMSAQELMAVLSTLTASRDIKRYFSEIEANLDPRILESRLNLVVKQGLKIIPLNKVEKELERCLDEYGEIRDQASNKLASLRSQIARLGNKIRDKMDSIVKSSQYQHMLQDHLITRRGDRYVVPVKHEYRNAFNGIVHDQSASGMTLFMEPLAVVRMNNQLSELKRAEEEEIYKVLQRLSGLVQLEVELIAANLKIITLLDVTFARAAYSGEIAGIAPAINSEGIVKIKQGRHPLLHEAAVPIDIEVGKEFKTLVITGPNTGGKTVALKTVGLFVLMVECGLHIPAQLGTEIAVFQHVFADIGDEQSIEENLSTFSSHINRIKGFLEIADAQSLILLDELGVGTDPREGAALGIAILEELRKRGAVTIATTHYSQLKSYAYTQEGVENAAVEFDLETLRPSYRLLMGIPGGSNAFAIALRLGIQRNIIAEARKLLSSQDLEVEKIIEGLNRERQHYQELRESFQQKEKEVQELKDKYASLVKELETAKKRILSEARQEAREIIKEARDKSKRIIRELKQQDFLSRPDIDRKANEINQNFQELEEKLSPGREEVEKGLAEPIAVGDQVKILSLGQKGEVVAIAEDKEEAVVQAGIMTITAKLGDLLKLELPAEKSEELIRTYQVKKKRRVAARLDLRGERYETAQHRLDKYLDDVFLAGLKQVEIVHGKGTGALREAVKEILEKNPHVSSFRLGRQEEGGDGVTIVSIT